MQFLSLLMLRKILQSPAIYEFWRNPVPPWKICSRNIEIGQIDHVVIIKVSVCFRLKVVDKTSLFWNSLLCQHLVKHHQILPVDTQPKLNWVITESAENRSFELWIKLFRSVRIYREFQKLTSLVFLGRVVSTPIGLLAHWHDCTRRRHTWIRDSKNRRIL